MLHLDNNILVTESRLDWLTVTAKDQRQAAELYRVAGEMADVEQQMGNFRRPFNWRGYVGDHCGSVTFGRREDGTMCQLTGWAAEQWFSNVYRLADNVTRLDVCVTARFNPAVEGVARGAYEESLTANRSAGVRASSRLIVGSDGGSTCYIGSPKSDRLARIYDKFAESGRDEYAGCWRWEVQYKSQLANDLSSALSGATDRARYCRGIVRDHFASRGIAIPF